jgi:hypothetical protein
MVSNGCRNAQAFAPLPKCQGGLCKCLKVKGISHNIIEKRASTASKSEKLEPGVEKGGGKTLNRNRPLLLVSH